MYANKVVYVLSKAGVGKGRVCPLWGNGAFGGGYEDPWENLHLFRRHGSPDWVDIVTVSPGEITAQPARI